MATLEAPIISDTLRVSPVDRLKNRGFFWCLFLVLVIPILLYPTAFLVVSMPSYERWATSKWGPVLDYAFDTQPKNADVLIFGDSSAFLGIDPRLVNKELGIKSIVLPATIGSLPVVGDHALRTYLSHNKLPQLLVLYFAPWNLDYKSTGTVGLFEGEEMLFRYGAKREVIDFIRQHPQEFFKFPFRFYSSFTPTALRNAWTRTNRKLTTANALGHVDYTEDRPALASPCNVPQDFLNDSRMDSVEDLVRRYNTQQIRVMVYLAPIPDCVNVGPVIKRSYGNLGAVPPKLLPSSYFSDDPYYAHLRPVSVPAASELFAQALSKRLQQTRFSQLR